LPNRHLSLTLSWMFAVRTLQLERILKGGKKATKASREGVLKEEKYLGPCRVRGEKINTNGEVKNIATFEGRGGGGGKREEGHDRDGVLRRPGTRNERTFGWVQRTSPRKENRKKNHEVT